MNIDKEHIGIAILSTDRPKCLQRLLKSIEDHSNTDGLCVLVIDDSTDPDTCESVANQYPWTVFTHTGERIGIAANTNRAMWAMTSYPYHMIMNNDVEVMRIGWQYYYFLAMEQTGFHHFCFQQEGLWGAGTKKRPEVINEYYKRKIKTIANSPQGAILTYDQKAFSTVGYFDAHSFIGYGKSHWDWSFRISESGIQPKGIHDVVGSNRYFKVHDELCTTPTTERLKDYQKNGLVFDNLRNVPNRIYIDYA